MAERKSGLPVDPTSPLISQIIAPLVPMSYQVDRPYSVNATEVDGGYIYSETPMKVSDLQFGTPPIISGGIEFFQSLMENPTETASGIATAVADELAEYPQRQIRTAMAGGEYYNPETGEVERYDPLSVPASQAVGTAASIAKAEGLGPFIGMLGGKSADNSLVQKFGFYQDNPDITRGNNDYTRENIEYLEKTRPEGDDYLRGPQTAVLGVNLPHVGVDQQTELFLPSGFLKNLPGAANETRMAGDPQFDRLMDSVKEGGFDPDQKGNKVVVGVNHLGQAYILEGNTRAAVAAELGVPSVKTEVRYFNGAEMVDGPFSPQRMAAYSEFGIQTGGDIFGMAGGRRSRPTDPVSAVDLGGGRQGVAGLAHGVKRGMNASKNIKIRMADLVRVNKDLKEPAQRLLRYAEDNNLIGPDGNISIDRAEFVTLMGLDNRIRAALVSSGRAATSAEVDRKGFSVSGDPYLSFVNFAGEAGDYKDLDELLVAETSGLTRKDVQDLSPSEYLMAVYDSDAKVLKKPNTKFFEDESHLGKDSQDYSTMRRLTDQERDRFAKIAEKNDAAVGIAGKSFTLFKEGRADIFDVARSAKDAFNNVQGVHAERMVEFSILDRLAKAFDDPNQLPLIHSMEDSLGENGTAELADIAQAYRMARNKVVGDTDFHQKVFGENALALKNAYKEDLAQTHPDFANGLDVDALGERGKRITGFKFDREFLLEMQKHAENLQSGDKAALEISTANLKQYPLHKRFTFEDEKTGQLKFRAMLPEDQIKYPDVITLSYKINDELSMIDQLRDGRVTKEDVLSSINNNIPTSFAGPLKQLAKNAQSIEERVRTNINKRPRAAELNQAYRDYKKATQEFVDHLSRIADQGPQSPLYNYMDRSGPEKKFSDITVRDNPAVKFEKGGPVRAGIADFIPYMVQ